MGYELDRLMKQYGVSTPTVAGYSGSVAPGAPPAEDASQADKDAFLTAVTRYGVDKKAYDTYTKEYANRIAGGNMYNQPQYNTSSTPSPTYRYGQPLPTPRPATPTPAPQDPIKAPTNALFSADMVGWTEAQKQDYYNRLRAQGYTTPELRASVQKVLGVASPNDEGWKYLEDKYKVASTPKPVVVPPVVVPPVINTPVVTPPVIKAKPTTPPVYTADMVNLTPAQKIAYYNSQRDLGYTVPQLRTSVENVLGTASPNDEGWQWLEDKYNAPVTPTPVASAPAMPAAPTPVTPTPVTPAPVTPQLYTGLTSGSNAQDIANAYGQYVGGMGGNTAANQTTAMNYLTNLGLSNDAIQAAYQKYLNPQATQNLQENTPIDYTYQDWNPLAARGGSFRDLVAKYADGGPVRRRFQDGGVNNLNRGPNYGLDVPMPSLDAPDPLRSINTAPIDPNKALASAVQSRYSQDITNMMTARDAAEKELMDNFRTQSEEKMTSAPSKAETYFRLASAFAEPGQTGSFGEGLGRAAGVMGDYQQAVRESDTANSLAKRAMQNELLKYSAGAAQSKLDSMIKLEDNLRSRTNMSPDMRLFQDRASLTPEERTRFDEWFKATQSQSDMEMFNNATPEEKEKMLETWAQIAGAKSVSNNIDISPEALQLAAEQYLTGDTSAASGYGRSPRMKALLADEIARQAALAGLDGRDIAAIMAEYQGMRAGQRTLATRETNAQLAVQEAISLMPLALAASEAVDRTQFPSLNKALIAFEAGTGDEAVVRLGIAVNSFINVYARAVSPVGTPTVSDKEHARELLEGAWAKGQFAAGIDQLNKEMQAALRSPEAVRASMRSVITGKEENTDGAAEAPLTPPGVPAGSTLTGTTPDGKNNIWTDPEGKQWRAP